MSTASEIIKWFIVAMYALGTIAAITHIGKPRRPLTAGLVAGLVTVNTIYVTLIIIFWQTP